MSCTSSSMAMCAASNWRSEVTSRPGPAQQHHHRNCRVDRADWGTPALHAPAAQAASLGIGGLYHYFPTKRKLVLHGLCPAALLRYCDEFHTEFGHLSETNPRRYLKEGINVVVRHVKFCRPSIQAASELGSESFWEVIETLLASTTLDFEVHLQQAAPEISADGLHQCGQAIRRSICAALLDKRMHPDELRDELRILVDGYLNRVRVPEPLLC